MSSYAFFIDYDRFFDEISSILSACPVSDIGEALMYNAIINTGKPDSFMPGHTISLPNKFRGTTC